MTAETLRECRERLGLTQVELAREVGICSDTLARWERGERKIPKTDKMLVLKYLLPQRKKAAERYALARLA